MGTDEEINYVYPPRDYQPDPWFEAFKNLKPGDEIPVVVNYGGSISMFTAEVLDESTLEVKKRTLRQRFRYWRQDWKSRLDYAWRALKGEDFYYDD